MKSKQLFFENLIAQNALGGIPEGYNFEGKTLYQIFSDLFKEGTVFTTIALEPNAGLEFSEIDELRTKYNTLIPDAFPSQPINLLPSKPASYWKTKNIVQVLDEILFQAAAPTYVNPTIALSDTLSPIQEVGDTVTNTLTLVGTKNDAGDFTSLRILKGNTEIGSSEPASGLSVATFQFPYTFQVAVGITTWIGKGSYNDGARKTNSQGIEDPRPYALRSVNNPQLGDDDFTSNSTEIDGIYPYFYGVSSSPITPQQIKTIIENGSGNKTLIKADGTISIQFNANIQYLWFAHANIYPTKTKWQASNNQFNAGDIGGPTDLFGAHSIQQIISPDGSPDPYWTIDYKIYISTGRTSTNDNGIQYSLNLKNS